MATQRLQSCHSPGRVTPPLFQLHLFSHLGRKRSMLVYSREVIRAYTAYGKLVPSLLETITTRGMGWAAQLSTTTNVICTL